MRYATLVLGPAGSGKVLIDDSFLVVSANGDAGILFLQHQMAGGKNAALLLTGQHTFRFLPPPSRPSVM
jgi:hypothetical protein